ncbi:MAG: PLP-dependent aminotransferase family protein [Halioglobus sp.]
MDIPSLFNFTVAKDLPLQPQLYQQLVNEINRGTWQPGSRLPPSRHIALELNISRNTVAAVFEQLVAEGFIVSRQGSGVYVNDELPPTDQRLTELRWTRQSNLPSLSAYGQRLRTQGTSGSQPPLPFSMGIPDLAAFPTKIWAQIQRRHQDRRHLLGYDGYQGYAPLRNALSTYLRVSRHVRCTPEQIVITHGTQQAISLCAQVLLNSGDDVLVENPGYIRARRAFAARDAKLIPVEVSPEGLTTAALPTAHPAQLMYVTPTHHYPLGGIMSAAERLKILDWAAANNTWLIEDDYDSEFHFSGKPIAALQGMALETPVLYMGSFSKTLFPALRLGYLVLPTSLVEPFALAKSYESGESPLLSQATTTDFIQEGHFVRHLRRMRQIYQQKWLHMSELINLHLKTLATPVAESAGMHIALMIEDIDDVTLAHELTEAGFGGSALSSYYVGENAKTGLVLGFSNSQEKERIKGIKMLKKLIGKHRLTV